MDAIETIKTRRAVRAYEGKPIPKEILEEIIDCARLAPSAKNVQPWEFVVVTDKTKNKRIAELTDYGKHIESAAACIVVCCRNTKYFLEDGCAATENILLAAKALGIGSCWVAGHKKPYCDEIRKLLEIPKDLIIISLVPLGYPKGKTEPHNKRMLEEVIHWEGF